MEAIKNIFFGMIKTVFNAYGGLGVVFLCVMVISSIIIIVSRYKDPVMWFFKSKRLDRIKADRQKRAVINGNRK